MSAWDPWTPEHPPEVAAHEEEFRRIERRARREHRMFKIGQGVITGLGYLIAVLALTCAIVGLLALLVVLLRVVTG